MKYLAPLMLLAACGDPVPGPGIPGSDGGNNPSIDAGSGPTHDGGASQDAAPLPNDAGDVTPDSGLSPDSGIPAGCDEDSDGYLAERCGGDDCNDDDRNIHPEAREICSFEDENCERGNNEDLDCTFFAHGPSDLYKVDPFAQTVEVLGEMTVNGRRVSLFDMDLNPEGELIGINGNRLIRFDQDGRGTTIANIETPSSINGLAIDSQGTIFLTQSNGRPAQAYTVTMNGDISVVGSLDPYTSSGDCVVLKDDSLLMTARGERNDLLVYVDSRDATTRALGAMGASAVYGLSASFGYLFGLTNEGKVLLVNPDNGATQELFRRRDVRFWGAANGD